jgi:hypothetical protein
MSLTIPYQFAPLPIAVLFDNELSGTFKEIFSYMLYRKNIAGWVIRKTDICNKLNLSMSTVKRGLKKLRELGYAHYDTSGWTIYPNRQAPKDHPIGSIMTPPTGSIMPPLYKEDSLEIKKQQHQLPIEIIEISAPEKPVVVFFDAEINFPEPIISPQALPVINSIPEPIIVSTPEPIIKPVPQLSTPTPVTFEEKDDLVFPAQLPENQKKACKAKIKIAPVELQQDVLYELAYRMTLQTIRNVPGFLNTLAIAAQNGTFTRTGTSGAVNKVNPAFAATQALFDKRATFKKPDAKTHEIGMAALKAACR